MDDNTVLEVESWPLNFIEIEILEEEKNEDCVEVELTGHDESEIKQTENFLNSTCCLLLCNSVIPKELIIQHRQRMQELDKHEQDMVVLASIHSHQRIPELNDVYHERSKRMPRASKVDAAGIAGAKSTSSRSHMKYFFAGLEVCKSFYLFANDIGSKRYANLVKYHKENGLSSREHKLKNSTRTWGNVLLPYEIEYVVEFIKNYGETRGIPLSGRVSQSKTNGVIKLSSGTTKKSIWDEYTKISDVKKISYSSFGEIWQKYCPYIKIMKPATDVCDMGKGDKRKKPKRKAKK